MEVKVKGHADNPDIGLGLEIPEIATLDASNNHPLMKRFQDTLQKHLVKHRENLIFEHQEMTKEFKLKKKEREDCGARLFELQKSIAKQKANLEGVAELYQKCEPRRGLLEDNLAKVKDLLSQIEDMVQSEKKNEVVLLRRIDVLNRQCHKLTGLKDSLKSDVTALRLATRKSSNSFSYLENSKEKQDEQINRLLLAVHGSETKLANYKTQIVTLNDEVQSMKSTLSTAKVEIEAIDFEGKSLLDQWHRSLDKMRTRDETLSALQESFLLLQESLKISRSELKSLEKSISKEEAASRQLSSLHLNLDSKTESLSSQLASNFEGQQSVKLELTTLKCDLEQMEHSTFVQLQIKTRREAELSNVTKTLQETITDKQRLQDALREQYLSYNFSDKSLQTMLKESQKNQEKRKTIQAYKNRCQSELAKAQSDMEERQDNLIFLEDELCVLHQIVETAEQNGRDKESYTKKLQILIDKRQQETNKLRHKVDLINTQSGSSDQGPIELQMSHLQRSLAEHMLEGHMLQNTWLRQQTCLVNFSQQREKCLAEMRHLQSQSFIYAQKKLQLEGEIENAGEEYKIVQKRIENLHIVISKLNLQSFRDHAQEESLQSVTILSEEDLLSRLKVREEDLINVREHLDTLREEEEDVSQKLLDAENELSLWQQKYALMKQVKAAVDSEYKKGEIHDLHNNLHKMQVKYSGLCKQQGRLVQGMEKAVQRWDVLLEKGERKIVGGSTAGANVNPLLRRQVEDVRSRIKMTAKEASELQEDIHGLEQRHKDLIRETEFKQMSNQRFITNEAELKNSLEEKSQNRLRKFEEIVIKQKQARAYQAIERSTYKPLCETQDILEYELNKQRTYSHHLLDVAKQLADDFPAIGHHFNRIYLRHSAQVSTLGV